MTHDDSNVHKSVASGEPMQTFINLESLDSLSPSERNNLIKSYNERQASTGKADDTVAVFTESVLF